ncbi:MAG: pyridoxal phosphate-dependent aminotransferase [Smithellaceae bacterium]|nr:pyridoxal phosphate-dependent aminotransferase [Smithellaceae bacterium]
MTIAKKVADTLTKSSWIRRMFEEGINLKKIHGADKVFDFSLGNPNIEPPSQVKEHLQSIINQASPGMHAYMPNAGYPETRAALAEHISRQNGISLSGDQVVMTCGAGGALNVVLKTLLDPGDEVVIPAPYFVEYRFYVDNAGGETVLAKTREDFSLDISALDQAIGPRTKVVLINSPNNPTGKVYDEASLKQLATLLREKSRRHGRDIFLVSDEPYRDIAFDVKIPGILGLYQNSIVVSSYSKSLSLPGERIGYIAANPAIAAIEEIMGGLVLCNRILGFVNAPALMQRLIARLQGVTVNVEEYRRKRDLLCRGLGQLGYKFNLPEGAFYLFPESPIPDDVEFIRILQKQRILAVPGSGFGGPGYFRIAYCVADETITRAMEGFDRAMRECRQG